MGQSNSRHDGSPQSEGIPAHTENLYRSRSSRSFADITISVCRRGFRRVREYLREKSRPKVENIELSPTVTSIQDFEPDTETAMEAQALDYQENISTNRTKINLKAKVSTAGEGDDRGNKSENDTIAKVENLDLSREIEAVKLKYLDFPFLEDELTIQWIKKNRIVFVMRGLPGSGKSTIVKAISDLYQDRNPIICSADNFFISKSGDYSFNPSFLQDAHEASQSCMKNSVQEGEAFIIVDNTNVERWEMKPYFMNAETAPYTYRVIVVEPKTPWKLNLEMLVKKNSHGVDENVIRKRIDKFLPVNPLYYAWFLSPLDSQILLAKTNELFKFLYENCQEFKSNFAAYSSMLNFGSAETYYNRDMFNSGDRNILHCTAKFFGFSKPQKNKTSPRKNSKTTKDSVRESEYSENVQENLGHVQKLKIIGYFFTEHTVGCRIELSDNQQKLYDQEEDFHSLKKRQFGSTTKSPTKKENSNAEGVENCALTSLGVTNVDLKYENSKQRFYPIPGRGKRAHITLGTAKGARAVNTGIDLLDIVLAEKNANEVANNNKPFEMKLESCKAVVRHYKPNFWVVYPEEGILMDSMFTGHY